MPLTLEMQMYNASIKKIGGTFHVGKVKDGHYLPPEASKHNDLLSSFLYRPLNNISINNGYTHIGDSDTPNTPTTSTLAGWKNVSSSSITQEKEVTFDEVTRILYIRQVYRTTGVLGGYVGVIREVGREWFRDTNNGIGAVDARAVLDVPITVTADEQFYVDYVAEVIVEMPPASASLTVPYSTGDLVVDLSFRIEDLELITATNIFKAVNNMEISYYHLPLSDNKPHKVQYTNNIKPTASWLAVDKVLSTKVVFSTTIGNGDWGSGPNYTGLMTVIQTDGNFSYQFNPGLPKTEDFQIEFNFIQDYSAVITL